MPTEEFSVPPARRRNYRYRIEGSYVIWIKRFIYCRMPILPWEWRKSETSVFGDARPERCRS